MSVYEKYKARRNTWGIDALESVIVQIELTNGIIGGEAACFIIEKHFSGFLKGQDSLNIEYLWDVMYGVHQPVMVEQV